jgi:hypothetical protein
MYFDFRKNDVLFYLYSVTLQHGQYIDYRELETVNVINYKHCVSDYFLAWGRNTELLINKYCPRTHVVVCGKPNIQLESDNVSFEGDSRFCLIVLDQCIFDKQNFEMIQIVKNSNLNLDIYVKFHPSNNKLQYYKKFDWIIERGEFKKADLVIGHTTSVIYEALTLNIKTLRYATDIPALKLPNFLEFSSVHELNDKLEYKVLLAEISYEFIECIEEESLTKYKSFFNDRQA